MRAIIVRQIVQAAVRSIDRGDLVEARVVAEMLLAHVLGTDRAGLYARSQATASPEQAIAFMGLLDRYRAGEPAAYLTGHREFYGIDLRVTPAVLIPRPETEQLVDRGIAIAGEFRWAGQPVRIADIGTGSGAIAIALARQLPAARLWAIDTSAAALAVARENAGRLGLGDRIRFLAGDLVDSLPEAVEVMMANLPYVPSGPTGPLAETAGWEPGLALDGGPDGLRVIRRFLARAGARLRRPGAILLEIGAGQGEPVRALAERFLAPVAVSVEADAAGHDRVVVLRCFP